MTTPASGATTPASNIPVLRPRLPAAERLLPYLQRIDENRVYSNWGPLTMELSARLCALFALPAGGDYVNCANSGMSALVGAILGACGRATPERPLAILPDFTFTATGLAAQACGHEVVLADCRADSWMIQPDDLLAQPALLARTGVVIPVAPFGRTVDQAAWLRFREQTGIPVVIDGAACFDAFVRAPRPGIGALPVALSFHATKVFGTGEGGAVVCTDTALANRIWQCLNFGFQGSRNSLLSGINGKLSEYAAAVGLAELDGWPEKERGFAELAAGYRQACDRAGVPLRLWGAPDISACYVLLQCESSAQAAHVMQTLAADNIDTRLWYGNGLAAHTVFQDARRLPLAGMHPLDARTLVGLPVAPDLSVEQVQRVCASVQRALAG